MSADQPEAHPQSTTSAGALCDPVQPIAQAQTPANHLLAVLRAVRPRQWPKNLIVFMALLFSIDDKWQLADPSSWLDLLGWTLLTFLLFCLVSSADYLVNDIVDRESDRQHPRKRKRPIAAGELSVRAALIWAIALAAVAIGGAFAITWSVGAVISGYLALMLAYTFWLKHIVLLDMMVIGAGFVLRAMAGGLAIDVPISPWLYVVTALGALFLVINKRSAEIKLLKDGSATHRPILEEYSPELLGQIGALVTASTLIAYGLYTFTAENLPNNNSMMLTIPFVLYGLLRYLYLVDKHDEGGSPEEVLLRDRPLQADILLWIATAATVLVVFRD
ncbi:MAG: decaprenyl-phosphate phosphoribosyltransferase [Chloroflexi bacterium]|nr:decaprenyl-phosphate phosphoribosyltransferase [Chloroflexota bacterium]MCI0855468.1 decaprenyl-phosphate phosphoribosyltransferase [Chloroflexota bacterium]MCI0889813.1 decaprenyl-phosphate phosphoribosyltransferase [Chloroflexota bacterium]